MGSATTETASQAQRVAGNGAPAAETAAELTGGADSRLPFQLADIYRMRLVMQPAVSPDGTQIAFIMHGYRERENKSYNTLWLAPSDGGAPARALTRSDANDSAPAWSPDGRTLAYLSTRSSEPDLKQDDSKDDKDEPKQQIWLLDLGGGEPRQLTNRAEGVNAFDWSPDGHRIVFEARDPSEEETTYLKSIRGKLEGTGDEKGPYVITRAQHKWDGLGYLDNVRTHLFTIDVESRHEQRLTSGPCNETEPRWSPTGEWIAFVSNRTGDPDTNRRFDLWLVSPDGAEARRLTFGDLNVIHPRWSPDGSDLVFTATERAEDWAWGLAEVYLVGLDQAEPVASLAEAVGQGWSSIGGVVPAVLNGDPVQHAQVFPVPLRSTPRRSLTGVLDRPVEGPAIWLNQDELVVPVGDRGRRKLVRVSRHAAPEVVYPVDDEQSSLFGLDAAGGTIALAINRAEGSDLASLPVADLAAAPRPLTQVNREIFAERQSVTYATISFQNSEGQTIEGVVIQPPGFDPANGPLPLVLYPHGGPMGYDIPCLQFYPDFFTGDAYLAGQGYLVLQVNYRGSTTYGQAFTEVIRGDLGPREYEDIRAGVDYLIGLGWADPERLFVTGVSYGGYLTSWSTGSTGRFRAAVPDLPAWDFSLSVGAGDLHLFTQVDYGLYWHNAEAYLRSSPSSLVMNTTTPSLIMAGEKDWRCPPNLSEAYYIALKKIGVPAELVIYQDDHHAYTRPRRAIDRLIRICKWFELYGGQPFTDDSAEGYPSQS